MDESGWKNFGDVNFMDHGGSLVKPAFGAETVKNNPSLASYYNVFYAAPSDLGGNLMYAGLCAIDIQDAWINHEQILSGNGLTRHEGCPIEEEISAEEWAARIVEWYGLANCCGQALHAQYPASPNNWTITKEEMATWLKDIGAGEFAHQLQETDDDE